jgi:divalent metal cation (Fe/Co/Zn/Cd) transporter
MSVGYMKTLVEQKFGGDVTVRSIKLRQTGMISRAEIHVEMDGSKSLNDVEMVLLNTEKLIKSKMPSMDVVLVVPHEQRKK